MLCTGGKFVGRAARPPLWPGGGCLRLLHVALRVPAGVGDAPGGLHGRGGEVQASAPQGAWILVRMMWDLLYTCFNNMLHRLSSDGAPPRVAAAVSIYSRPKNNTQSRSPLTLLLRWKFVDLFHVPRPGESKAPPTARQRVPRKIPQKSGTDQTKKRANPDHSHRQNNLPQHVPVLNSRMRHSPTRTPMPRPRNPNPDPETLTLKP